MMNLHPKYLSGIVAVGIYFALIGLVFYYFGYHSQKQPIHYVTKNANAITVSLQSPPNHNKAKHTSIPTPSKPNRPKKIKHTKPKPIVSKKPTRTKPLPTKKKRPVNKHVVKKKPVKKIKAKSLFSHIKTRPKSKPKATKKPQSSTRKKSTHPGKTSRESLKQQQARDKGIENRYLASVQDKLYGWPSQSNFAGARITIGLTIYPSGRFDYRVLTPSANPEFNRTIQQYLTQLQAMGFGPTPKGKKYAFKVEIVAK